MVAGQRVAALRFPDARVQAVLSALVLFRLLPEGFTNSELRAVLAPLLGLAPSAMTSGMMSYQLRRLRLHGLVARTPGTYRYRVTEAGLRSALFFTRAYTRLLRPGLAHVMPSTPPGPSALRKAFDALETAIDRCYDEAKLAA